MRVVIIKENEEGIILVDERRQELKLIHRIENEGGYLCLSDLEIKDPKSYLEYKKEHFYNVNE